MSLSGDIRCLFDRKCGIMELTTNCNHKCSFIREQNGVRNRNFKEMLIMKRLLSVLLVFFCMITLSGCKNEAGQVYFNARVLEVNEGFVFVRCSEAFNSGISVGEELPVTTDVVADKGVPEMKVGDNVRVVFNGDIMESDPLQLGTVFAIYLLDENGEVIPND